MIGFMKKEYLAGSTGFLLAVNTFKVDARKKFKGMSVLFKRKQSPKTISGRPLNNCQWIQRNVTPSFFFLALS